MSSITICALVLLVLCGCTTVIQSSYGVAVDERKVGTIASDKEITLTIQKKFLEDDAVKLLDTSPFCYNSHVYLVGEYGTEKERERALRSQIMCRASSLSRTTCFGRKKRIRADGRITSK